MELNFIIIFIIDEKLYRAKTGKGRKISSQKTG